MNDIKEKIQFLEKQIEGVKKIKTWACPIEKSTMDKSIKLLESMIKDYENIGQAREDDLLLNAVKTIKNYCNTQDDCKNCRLGRINRDCVVIEECPEDWVLNNTSKILI